MVPIVMPQVGHHIKQGSIVKWHKNEKDPVEKGEVILTVESEKAAFEVEAEESGILLKILHQEGEEAEVLKPVGYIGEPGEVFDESVLEAASVTETAEGLTEGGEERTGTLAVEPRQDARVAVLDTAQPQQPVFTGKIKASPVAKKLAARARIDLRQITGSGPGGRIVKLDVLAALRASGIDAAALLNGQPGTGGAVLPQALTGQTPFPAAPVAPAPSAEDQVIPFGKVRQVIANRLTSSKQSIPHFYLFLDVDVEDTLIWRESFNSGQNAHLTVTDLVVHATSRALREFGRLNAHVESDRVILKAHVNVGVATSVEDGILVPVVPDTDRKNLSQISQEIKKVTEEARKGLLPPDTERTFTITSLGMFGITACLPIINPPECGILGVGVAEPRVVAVGSLIGVRRMMTLSLACDHRAVDGAYAAPFLRRIGELLSRPFG
jgi:pyruvate dehydrogenase E2 component (dihydrolipoamide acetyltransferase)